MTIYVVRHALARPRKDWDGDDMLRPLNETGHAEAKGLWKALGLAGADIRHVYSSPALRCMTTVEPLAARAGRPVEPRDHLAEETDGRETLELLRRLLAAKGDYVVCAHGDQLPSVVLRLALEHGIRLPGAESKKGSTWVLTADGKGRLRRPRYVPPPK